MYSPTSSKQSLAYIFTFTAVLLALVAVYSKISTANASVSGAYNESNGSGESHSELTSTIYNNNVFLAKNDKLEIGRTALQYKGISKGKFLIDLYLLDLDRQQSYLKSFTIKEKGKEIHLGDCTFKLISAKKNYVNMQLLSLSSTP